MKTLTVAAISAAFLLAACGTVEKGLGWLGDAKDIGKEKALEGTIVGAENYCATFSEAARHANRNPATVSSTKNATGISFQVRVISGSTAKSPPASTSRRASAAGAGSSRRTRS